MTVPQTNLLTFRAALWYHQRRKGETKRCEVSGASVRCEGLGYRPVEGAMARCQVLGLRCYGCDVRA